MEVNFDNPGHREELERLGILKPNESQISIEDLVNRTIESRNIEPVVYILRQQLANNYQELLFVDNKLNRAKKETPEIHDKKSLQVVQNRVSQVIHTLDKATGQSENLITSTNNIMKAIEEGNFQNLLTSRVFDHVEVMNELIDNTRKVITEKGDLFSREVDTLQITINGAKNKF